MAQSGPKLIVAYPAPEKIIIRFVHKCQVILDLWVVTTGKINFISAGRDKWPDKIDFIFQLILADWVL